MVNKKLTELPPLSGSELADDDLFYVVDRSDLLNSSKSISKIQLDDAWISRIGGIGGIFNTSYDVRSDVASATIIPSVDAISTGGYTTPGDGGGALYKRVAVQPTHAGKIQSADGAWWELAESTIDLRMLGAVAGATTAVHTAALLAAVAMCESGSWGKIRLPPHPIAIDQTITIVAGSFAIEGYGRDISLINHLVLSAPLFLVTGELAPGTASATYLDFRDFRVEGNNVVGALGSGHAFALHDPLINTGTATPQMATMERISIRYCRGNGLEGAGVDSLGTMMACGISQKGGLGCYYNDVEVLYCGAGIYISRSQNCALTNIQIAHCDRFGLFDYRNAALRVTDGDIQANCEDGTTITVPLSMIPANIMSNLGDGTIFKGIKTKGVSGLNNANVYIMEGIGVKLWGLWVQATSTTDHPPRGIVINRSASISIKDCTIGGVVGLFPSQKITYIELLVETNAPAISGEIVGNQFVFPPGGTGATFPPYQGVATCIKASGNSAARLIDGLTIANNVFGSRVAVSSGNMVVDDLIFFNNCTLTNVTIKNNTSNILAGVTVTNCVRFTTVTDRGDNWFFPNTFIANGGTVTTLYTGLASFKFNYNNIIPQMFGAVGDGVTDDSAAFNAVFAAFALSETSPAGLTSYGNGHLHIPKGKYLINSPLNLTTGKGLGLLITGDGIWTTTLLTTNLTGNMFNFAGHFGTTIRDLAIIHNVTKAANPDPAWTNKCFAVLNTGGGRKLSLENVYISGFDRQISNDDTTNGDNLSVRNCIFTEFNTHYWNDSTQTINTSYKDVLFTDSIGANKCFDCTGGPLSLRDIDCTIKGNFLNLRDTPAKYGVATHIVLDNVALEWRTGDDIAGKPGKFIVVDGNDCVGDIYVTGCKVNGGSTTPHVDALWMKFGGPMRIFVKGGNFDRKFELAGHTSNTYVKQSYVEFDGTGLDATNFMVQTAGGAGSSYPQVVLKNCPGIAELTIAKDNSHIVDPRKVVVITDLTTSYMNLFTATFNYSFYAQPCRIRKIELHVTKRTGTGAKVFTVYSDAARTVLIGTATLTSGTSTAHEFYDFAVAANLVVTEGLFFSASNADANTIFGNIMIEYDCIGYKPS